jgi:hypothetical protein
VAQHFEPTVGNEANWVRSLYVYVVCLISMLVVLVGAAVTVSSAVTIISPSTGLTSGWERVLVGGTSVVEEGVKIAEEYLQSQQGLPDFCEGEVDEIDKEYCDSLAEDMATAGDEPVIPVAVNDAIAVVRDEVLHQVRMAAIGRLVIGLIVVVLGLLVFRRHKGLTALYQGAPKPTAVPVAPAPVQAAPMAPVAPPTTPRVPPAPPT